MRVTVAAWIGSTNLGDELVFSALVRRLRERGADICALSVDPDTTAATHGVDAVHHARPEAVAALRRSDAVVLGGGGLLQDRTSDLNLPYHLSRVLLTPRATPVVGIALGAGPLDTRAGRALVRRVLPRLTALSVRDTPSADLVASLGLPRPDVAADLALSLPLPTVDPGDHLVVCLRPWSGTRRRLPVHLRRAETPEWFLDTTATALDGAATALGTAIRFVALDPVRDHAVHEAVAARMGADVSFARPDLHGVLDELASGRAVVAMRYHAAIGAVLAGRPVVGIGYDPKVAALLAELGSGGRLLAWDRPEAIASLPTALASVLPNSRAVIEGRELLRARETRNTAVLDHLGDRRR